MPLPQTICPNCNVALPLNETLCPECGEELAALVRLRWEPYLLYNEGLRLARLGDLAGAAAKMRNVVAGLPDERIAYHVLAKLYTQLGNHPEAALWWEAALRRWPGDEAARVGLAGLARLAEVMATPPDSVPLDSVLPEPVPPAAPSPTAEPPAPPAEPIRPEVNRGWAMLLLGVVFVGMFGLAAGALWSEVGAAAARTTLPTPTPLSNLSNAGCPALLDPHTWLLGGPTLVAPTVVPTPYSP